MARRKRKNFRYGLLALAISAMLWGIAHGQSSEERGFDVPIIFRDLPEDLVITDQSTDEVNIRVMGSRAALRNLSTNTLEYAVNVSGAKAGRTTHEVQVTTQLSLPRGVRIVSRSPAQIELRLERKGRKNVRVRPDLMADPPPGFVMKDVVVDPPRVWLAGARSSVMRLAEIVTETIDLSTAEGPVEREVKLALPDHVWKEQETPVTVRIAIERVASPEGAAPAAAEGNAG